MLVDLPVLSDFIARIWAYTLDSETFICSHCNCQYTDALTHLIAECGCSQTLEETFLHDWIDILPPELLNGLTASDADTFVTAVLSVSYWSNLDTKLAERIFKWCIWFCQELLLKFLWSLMNMYIRGLSQKVVDFCYNTRPCISILWNLYDIFVYIT